MKGHSLELGELFAALAAVQGEMSPVAKSSVNPFFKSNYANLGDTLQAALRVTSGHGLSVSQWPGYNQAGQDILTTWVGHSSGQYICDETILHLAKPDPQSQGSAITYAKRYALQAALGISTEDDDDGQAASDHSQTVWR